MVVQLGTVWGSVVIETLRICALTRPAHSKAPSIFLQNFITTFSSSNYRKLNEERKISPVQISAEKQFTSLQNSTTFCFIFSPSARKKVLKVSCIAFFFKVFLTSTE
jgi:hypothetical protein